MKYEQGELFTHTPEPELDGRINYYWRRKADGSRRQVWHTTSEDVLRLHNIFLTRLRNCWQPLSIVTGGEPGDSPLEHVRKHRAHGSFYVLDIASAYDQVNQEVLLEELDNIGLGSMTDRHFLRTMALHPGGRGILLGMPASPTLFNIACAPLDRDLINYCVAEGIVVTRYLDDVVCSLPLERPFTKLQRREIRSMFNMHQWPLNQRKTRLMSHSRGPVILNGIQLDPNGGLRPSKRLTKKARLVIESALEGEESFARAAGYNGALVAASDRHRTPEVRRAQKTFYQLILPPIKPTSHYWWDRSV